MNQNVQYLEDIPVYLIDYSYLKTIAVENEFEMNKLSPFMDISFDKVVIHEDDGLKLLSFVLSAPDQRSFFLKEGIGKKQEYFSIYSRKIDKINYFLYIQNKNALKQILVFEDIGELSTYFVSRYASMVLQAPTNLMPSEMTGEEFIFNLNIIDCIRRNYYNGLLIGQSEHLENIEESEYLYILKAHIKSGDTRWLVPSALKLIPHIYKANLDLMLNKKTHLLKKGFVTPYAITSDEDALFYLTPESKEMGIEFTHYWKYAIGFDLSTVNIESKEIVEKDYYYFTPTDYANHLFKLKMQDDTINCNHSVYTFNEMLTVFEQIFEN